MANNNGTTAEEQTAIDALRARITDIYDDMEEFHRHDLSLLRFLKARDLNVDKAELMLRNNIKWRKENRMDEALQRKVSEDLLKRFPFKISGYDDEGSYISIVPVGKYDYRSILENGEKEDYIQYILQTSELAYELLKFKCTKEKNVQAAIVIMDYDQFSIRQMTSLETLQYMKEVMILLENNYPELLKTGYIINAPKVFEVLYNFFKPLLSKAMIKKIHIYSAGSAATWKAELLKSIPSDSLPSQYGGSNTTCQNYRFEFGLDADPKLVTLSESMTTEAISAGQKFSVDVFIKQEGQQLLWNFKTDTYDIGFHVYYHNINEVDNNNVGEIEELVSCPRCDSHITVQKGKLTCSKIGKYTLEWDNSFSTFRAKTLHYVYKTVKLNGDNKK